MASIANDKNGTKRILFVDPSGKRKTIRLGKSNKRIAETAKFHIEGLLSAKIAGHSPETETAKHAMATCLCLRTIWWLTYTK